MKSALAFKKTNIRNFNHYDKPETKAAHLRETKPSLKLLPFATVVLAASLAGCATKPIYQKSGQTGGGYQIITNSQGVPNYYQVKRGDTVSQIAARYGLNYRQIGAINGLDSRYTIYSGQWLKLWQGGNTVYSNTGNQNLGGQNSAKQQTPITAPAPVPNNNQVQTTLGYMYPSNNQVIRNFDDKSGVLGMWFTGRQGDPVVASQDGVVLYAGNGLAEYGNLVMIRHLGNYITAYAHNSKLLVSEGEQVSRGQQIATMGSTGQSNGVALEFQVRENGNPIDPRVVLGR